MSGEPIAKRAREENDEEDSALIALDKVQLELDDINERSGEEILKIEQKYNKIRRPVYDKRAEAIKNVDGFWPTAFLNHPQFSQFICEVEEPFIAAITAVNVEEFEEIKTGFRIRFTFEKNDYIENEFIEKEFHMGADPHTKVTEIKWKTGKNLLNEVNENRHPVPNETPTFIEWLVEQSDPSMDEIAEIIKDDIFPSPIQYFLLPDTENSDSDGDEIEDEVEGEEENE